QGFSAGGEPGGVSVYLSEIATPGRKGFFVSWQSGSQQVAVMFASLLGVLLSSVLSPKSMGEWGWRVPFLIGCMIVPFLFFIRRSLRETEEFEQRKHRPTLSEIFRSMGENWRLAGAGTLLAVMTTVAFYLITAYTPTFGRNVLHMSEFDSMIVTLCVGASNLFWLPVMGSLSDRIGRRPPLLVFSAVTLLTAYPAMMWLIGAPSFGRLLAVELWLSFLYAGYNGAMIVTLTEIMPPALRTTGFSLAYSLATAIFGGFTPAIATGLIHATGNKAMPGLWLSFAAICGLVATLIVVKQQPRAASLDPLLEP
ncbi:tricarballylate/proton symporter TcuC, partial [Ralstonia solanacearum]